MRYGVAVVMLFVVLPGMKVLAEPVPVLEPSGIFQLGPPSKGETEEQFRKTEIERQTSHASLSLWWMYLKESKLPSIASRKDPRPWMAKNLRITQEKGRRLRFTFGAGARSEQVAILNALLRVNLYWHQGGIESTEETIRIYEKNILELQKRIKWAKEAKDNDVEAYREGIHDLRTKQIPACRAVIARCKQFTVLKWAK